MLTNCDLGGADLVGLNYDPTILSFLVGSDLEGVRISGPPDGSGS